MTEQRPIDDVIAEAGVRHGDRLVFLCSFQKEESVLLDSIVRVAPKTRIVTIDTGVLFPETLDAWKRFEDHFGVHIDTEFARGNWTGPENCCGTEKVAALNRALGSAEGWITGIRREQSPTRETAEQVEHDEKRGIWKYNPLAFWTEKDLWKAITDGGLPYHALHDQNYASIGCACCTQPGDGRSGRWAGTEKTECGLHVV